MSTSVHQEIEWEHAAVDRGVRRYRESLMRDRNDGSRERRELAELEPGQEIMRHVVGPAHKALEVAAKEAHAAYGNPKRGREERWWFPILCVEPDVLAVIGVRAMLATREVHARPLRSVALEIGRNAQTQREFELWRKAQGKRTRESQQGGTPNYWRLMRELTPEVNERAFRKWAKKSEQYEKLDWPRDMRLHLGIKVVNVIAEAAPQWFTITMPGQVSGGRYKTERVVALTDEAREWVTARHTYNEMRRPLLVPMLVEPRDWTRVAPEEKRDGTEDRSEVAGCAVGCAGGGPEGGA